jgi:repressor LexA
MRKPKKTTAKAKKTGLQDSIIITPKQLAVLKYINTYAAKHYYSPTFEELSAALGISRPTVFEHITSLREKNLIKQPLDSRARCLQLTAAGKKLLENQPARASDTKPFNTIPMLGRVSAGYGIEAIEDKQTFGLTELFGRADNLFSLQVKGKSMIDAGINDGDYIICKSTQTAENGQLVVAIVDEQNATVKRFFKDARYVRLQPENDAFEPILSRDCKIQAVVVGLVRRI